MGCVFSEGRNYLTNIKLDMKVQVIRAYLFHLQYLYFEKVMQIYRHRTLTWNYYNKMTYKVIYIIYD